MCDAVQYVTEICEPMVSNAVGYIFEERMFQDKESLDSTRKSLRYNTVHVARKKKTP